MSSSFSTEWPPFMSTATRDIILRFFSTVDDTNPNTGDVLADEIFATDADAYFGGKLFHGPEEIRKSRDQAWNAISFRRHELLRVFAGSEACDDLMFLGRVRMSYRNGNEIDMDFTGRLKISGPETDAPKLKLYQVWADSAPVVAAMKGLGK